MSGLVRYTFPLGDGIFVTADLPNPLERHHVERLKRQLDTLCFDTPAEPPAKEDPILAEQTRAVMEQIRACTPGARLADVPTLFAFGPIYRALWEKAEALASCQRGRIGDAEHAGRLLSVIAGLKQGSCWCPMGIGHPAMKSHSEACLAAATALGALL